MPGDLSVSASSRRAVEAAGTPRGPRPAFEAKPARSPAHKDDEASAEDVRSAINDAIARLTEKGSELTFQLDDETGRVIVRLIDRNTREVLRQLPSKEALAVARALREGNGVGALVHTDA
jgi:flagellar protein FlaG